MIKSSFQPLDVMRAVANLPLASRHKAVLWSLVLFMDKEAKCWPSHATIAAKAGLSRSTVKTTLGELTALGHISKLNGSRAGKRQSETNVYLIHLQSDAEAAPVRMPRDARRPGDDLDPPSDVSGVNPQTSDPGQPPAPPPPLDPAESRNAAHPGQAPTPSRPPGDPGGSRLATPSGSTLATPRSRLAQGVGCHPTRGGPDVGHKLSMELSIGTDHGTGGEGARASATPRSLPRGPQRRVRACSDLALTGRGQRIPETWEPKPETLDRFRTRERVEAAASVERFRNHFLASSGRNAAKLDWDKAFINWVLRDCEEGRAKPIATLPGDAAYAEKTPPSESPREPIATGDDLARLMNDAARAASEVRSRMTGRLPAIERTAHPDGD